MLTAVLNVNFTPTLPPTPPVQRDSEGSNGNFFVTLTPITANPRATPHVPPSLMVQTPPRYLKGSRSSIGSSKGGGKAGSKGVRRLRKSHDGERENPRHTSARVKMSRALRDGCARAPSADGLVPALRATRRDERDILVSKHATGMPVPGIRMCYRPERAGYLRRRFD